MVNAVANRESISRMLDSIGTTMTVIPRSVSSTDKWGTQTVTLSDAFTTKAAPDNKFKFKRQGTPQGILDKASMLLITKGDLSVSSHDRIIYNDKVYDILRVQKYPLVGTPLAKQLFLAERSTTPFLARFEDSLFCWFKFDNGSLVDSSKNQFVARIYGAVVLAPANSLTNFSSVADAAFSINTDYYQEGGASVNVYSVVHNLSNLGWDMEFDAGEVDLTNKKVNFYLRFRDQATIDKFSGMAVYLESTLDLLGGGLGWNKFDFSSSDFVVGWNVFSLDVSNPDAIESDGADPTRIHSVRIRLTKTVGVQIEEGEVQVNYVSMNAPLKTTGRSGDENGAYRFFAPISGNTELTINESVNSSWDSSLLRGSDFSFAAWVRPRVFEGSYSYLFHLQDDEPGLRFVGSDESSYRLQFMIDGNVGNHRSFYFNDNGVDSSYFLNNWRHVVAVIDYGNELKLYVNGQEWVGRTMNGTVTNDDVSTDDDLRFGDDDSDTDRALDGDMDDVMVFTKKLTAEDVTVVYNN